MQNSLSRLSPLRKMSPLSARLLAYIVLCSALFTLVAAGIQIYTDYRQEVKRVADRLGVIETSYKASLSRSLWALDHNLLRVQMEGILSLPDIEHLRLEIYPDSEIVMGELQSDGGIMIRTFELVHEGRESYELGALTVTASMDAAYAALQQKLIVIFSTEAAKTFVLSVIILWIFQVAVTRHLGAMAAYATKFSVDHLDEPLRLDRAASDRHRSDELGQVTVAINQMRERLRDDLERQEQDAREIRKLSMAIEQSPSSVVICDRNWNVEYINIKFSQLTGHSIDDIRGQHPATLGSDSLSQKDRQQLWRDVRTQVQRVGVWQGEIHSVRRNGERFWEQVICTPIRDEAGDPSHFLILGEDISIRKRYEQQLLRQANYDILTGLPNRMLALDRLKLALAQARRENQLVGVMFLDLDNFKHINDTMGHDAGDTLLVEASRRISSCLRGTSTVARLGGDEFLVILPGVHGVDSTEQVADRILHNFLPPIQLGGQEVFISTSIGIAIYPTDSDSSGSLLQNADAAMYEAKAQGKSSYRRFSPEMKELSLERLQMESRLRRALELNEMELYYQPILQTADSHLIGAEALIRWNNPTMGLVSPDRFIPLAEETGMIVPIGRWVLNAACQANKRWEEATGQCLSIAVNVSPRQFRDPGFVEMVQQALSENRIPAIRLELEITERLILDNTIETAQILKRLDEMGVRLSVDDFGTGFSALGYLKSYPFDTLKIDKSFVRDVMTEQEDAALVKAIINMAHSLSLEVIAEGVEDADQLQFLREQGCDFAQGYFYSRPAPEADFLLWVAGHQQATV